MEKISSQMVKIGEVLDDMRDKAHLMGVMFSFRDGNIILDNLGENFDGDTFAAMSASVLASAEALGFTMRNQKIKKIISELNNYSLIFAGCDKKTFLVVFFNDNSNIEITLDNLNKDIKRLIELY